MATNGADVFKRQAPVSAVVDILNKSIDGTDNADNSDDSDTEVDLTGGNKNIDEVVDQNDGADEVKDGVDTEDKPKEDAAQTSGEVEIDSSTLAQLLGIDESDIIVTDDGSPRFRAKVDGKEQEISFDSLLRNFRLQQHVDSKATAVNQEREKLEAERKQMRDQYMAGLQQAAMIITANEDALMKEYQSVNWQALQASNPTEFIIQRDAFKERLHAMQSRRLELGAKWDEEQKKAQEEFQKNYQARVQKEAANMLELIPEWKDEKIAAAESAELKDYAIKQGFSIEEVNNLIDSRAWHVLRKAKLYDQSVGKVIPGEKKKVVIPKVSKAKASSGSDVGTKVKMATLKKVAAGGNDNAKVAFVSELLK